MSAENMRAMLSENLEKLCKASIEYFQMLACGVDGGNPAWNAHRAGL
jgi:hypothetical protein